MTQLPNPDLAAEDAILKALFRLAVLFTGSASAASQATAHALAPFRNLRAAGESRLERALINHLREFRHAKTGTPEWDALLADRDAAEAVLVLDVASIPQLRAAFALGLSADRVQTLQGRVREQLARDFGDPHEAIARVRAAADQITADHLDEAVSELAEARLKPTAFRRVRSMLLFLCVLAGMVVMVYVFLDLAAWEEPAPDLQFSNPLPDDASPPEGEAP